MGCKHATAQLLSQPDTASITISRVEYDNLLYHSHQLEMLKNALFAGGLTTESMAVLLSEDAGHQPRQMGIGSWADDYDERSSTYNRSPNLMVHKMGTRNIAHGQSGDASSSKISFITNPSGSPHYYEPVKPRRPENNRHFSSDCTDSSAFHAAGGLVDVGTAGRESVSHVKGAAPQTLYFAGFNVHTTYRDLASAIKGGQVLSINMQMGRSATVTFLDAAAEYLAWVKRNDLYIKGKRIHVKWAERQFRTNGHVSKQVAQGATRNLVIRKALSSGLTASQIREDMEHIHRLVIIDIQYRNDDALVSTNSVYNAMFTRTCMMSRKAYRGCKIGFCPDECDVSLPAPTRAAKSVDMQPAKKIVSPFANRFEALHEVSIDLESREESEAPRDSLIGASDSDYEHSDDATTNIEPRHGVRLFASDGGSVD